MKSTRAYGRMIGIGLSFGILTSIPASATMQIPPWVNGRPVLSTGDMLLDGCLRPGVEASCKMIDYRSQPKDLAGRPTGAPVEIQYGIGRIDPVPDYDRRIVFVARAREGGGRICGGTPIDVTNWYYSTNLPACPAREWSPFDN